MKPPSSLLELLQGAIERTYDMRTGIGDIDRFVLGDRGLDRLYGSRGWSQVVGCGHRDGLHGVGSGRGFAEAKVPGGGFAEDKVPGGGFADAKVLLREDAAGGVHARIYYPDALIAALEARNPLHGLDAANLDPFAVFVEELDHFLTLADRARAGRRVSLFELELHANATKYVTCRHFLERSQGRALDAGERRWLRWRLFERLEPPAGPPELRARYRDADRLGAGYARQLEALPPLPRLAELRRFHRRPLARTLLRIEAGGN